MAQSLDVAFIAFIRDELKFDSIEALVRQMDDDSASPRAARGAGGGTAGLFRSFGIYASSVSGAAQGFAHPAAGCYGKPMFARRTISISGPASA